MSEMLAYAGLCGIGGILALVGTILAGYENRQVTGIYCVVMMILLFVMMIIFLGEV